MKGSGDSRGAILTALRQGRAAISAAPDAPAAYRAPATLIGGLDQFRAYAGEEAATSECVDGFADVPAAVARYIAAQKLSKRVFVGAELPLTAADWAVASTLQLDTGAVRRDGDTLVTGCYAGVAEAGALITVSSSGEPNEAKFLASTHIAVLRCQDIVSTFEDLWVRLRGEFAEADQWPRTMNWIVGPSRTADLGVPSKLGAHGPARVHIIVVDG